MLSKCLALATGLRLSKVLEFKKMFEKKKDSKYAHWKLESVELQENKHPIQEPVVSKAHSSRYKQKNFQNSCSSG
jgi:hypothetical protein